MTDGGLKRTQHRNIATGTVRTSLTGHGESLADVESFLIPLGHARNAALLDPGVAHGLMVQATAGISGLPVLPGTAVDSHGWLIALVDGCVAIVVPDVDAAQVLHVPTVLVPDNGLALGIGGLGGDVLLSLTWREIQPGDTVATAAVLLHAPWLRLVASAAFVDSREQVVLGAVSVAADEPVTVLTPGSRSAGTLSTGTLSASTLRASKLSATTLTATSVASETAGGGSCRPCQGCPQGPRRAGSCTSRAVKSTAAAEGDFRSPTGQPAASSTSPAPRAAGGSGTPSEARPGSCPRRTSSPSVSCPGLQHPATGGHLEWKPSSHRLDLQERRRLHYPPSVRSRASAAQPLLRRVPETEILYTGTAVTGPHRHRRGGPSGLLHGTRHRRSVHLTPVDSLVAVTVASPVRDNTFTIPTSDGAGP